MVKGLSQDRVQERFVELIFMKIFSALSHDNVQQFAELVGPQSFVSGQSSTACGGGLHDVLSGQTTTASEAADSEMEDELEEVRHDDWVSMVDEHWRVFFFWNRRHNTTHRSMPLGTLHRWVRPCDHARSGQLSCSTCSSSTVRWVLFQRSGGASNSVVASFRCSVHGGVYMRYRPCCLFEDA